MEGVVHINPNIEGLSNSIVNLLKGESEGVVLKGRNPDAIVTKIFAHTEFLEYAPYYPICVSIGYGLNEPDEWTLSVEEINKETIVYYKIFDKRGIILSDTDEIEELEDWERLGYVYGAEGFKPYQFLMGQTFISLDLHKYKGTISFELPHRTEQRELTKWKWKIAIQTRSLKGNIVMTLPLTMSGSRTALLEQRIVDSVIGMGIYLDKPFMLFRQGYFEEVEWCEPL